MCQRAFPQLILTRSPTVLIQNHIFRKRTALTSKVFQHCRILPNSYKVVPKVNLTVKHRPYSLSAFPQLQPTDITPLLPSYQSHLEASWMSWSKGTRNTPSMNTLIILVPAWMATSPTYPNCYSYWKDQGIHSPSHWVSVPRAQFQSQSIPSARQGSPLHPYRHITLELVLVTRARLAYIHLTKQS